VKKRDLEKLRRIKVLWAYELATSRSDSSYKKSVNESKPAEQKNTHVKAVAKPAK
jgi:hypothetical protein